VETVIIIAFIILFSFEFLVGFVLNELNLRFVQNPAVKQEIPDFLQRKISAETYQKSGGYTLAKGRFKRIAEVYGALTTLYVLFGGVLPYFDSLAGALGQELPPELQTTGIFFCVAVGMLFSLLGAPLDVYDTFVIEERFGFNKTTLRLYLTDKLKGLLVGITIGVPFLFAVLWLMQATGSYWWIWAFLFVLGFELLMVVVYPTLIAPLFNKFTPLQDGEFRRRILALTNQTGFQASGIYTMDGSKRSTHSNAYFTGMGKIKRIVLFDTLIKQMSIEQGLAVLAHEIGHYQMRHIRRRMILQALFLLAGFYILSLLLEYEPLFRAFGLNPSHHAALVLFSFLAGPCTFYLTPWMNWLSRKHEYEADRFAVQTLKDGKAMEEALVHLSISNLSNLTPHPWYSAYYYSHPTVAERVAAIRKANRPQKLDTRTLSANMRAEER
jgi:STE24 endopeptidase